MSKPLAPVSGLRNISNGSQTNIANGPSPNGRIVPMSGPNTNIRQNSNLTRAERFEDEKHRIIDSCFSKLDANNQLAESYITHVRVTEDAQYPSSPPPPDSTNENKKPRVIIVAVRNTGRVRMHKARENANGSFSIGKTWNLEELSAIENFANSTEAGLDEHESQSRQWGGDTGFTVTITKPYFWQAGTSKEKDFFIASTVKIYRKYTRGQVPELRGFDESERLHILGAPGATPPLAQIPQASSVSLASTTRRDSSPAPPQPPFAQREHSRDGSRYRGSPGPPPSLSDYPRRPSSRHDSESPKRHNGVPGAHGPRAFGSQEHMRGPGMTSRSENRPGTSPAGTPNMTRSPAGPSPLAFDGKNHQQAYFTSDTPVMTSPLPGRETVQTSQKPFAVRVSGNGAVGKHDSAQDSRQDSSSHASRAARHPTSSTDLISPVAPQLPPLDSLATSQPMFAASEVPTSSSLPLNKSVQPAIGKMDISDASLHKPTPPFAHETTSPTTPERSSKRPPFEARVSDDLKPAPLVAAPRPLSATKPPVTADNARDSTPLDDALVDIKPLSIKHNRTSGAPAVVSPIAPVSTEDSAPFRESARVSLGADAAADPDEQYRPGLGPMIKKNAARERFKKAANAAGAFRPRPGGAAEKIMRAKADREAGIVPEPDGITSVVPRPQALQSRQASTDDVPQSKPNESATRSSMLADMAREPSAAIAGPTTSPSRIASTPVNSSGEALPSHLSKSQVSVAETRNSRTSGGEVTPVSRPEDEQDDEGLHDSVVLEAPVKAKVRSQYQNQCLDELGIDRNLLEGKGLEFEALLEEYGWKDGSLLSSQLSRLEHEISREQARLEAGSYLSIGADTARDEKVARVEALLDKTIAECDELDGLLTLYSVELGSLSDDITFVEAQSQGLQVQSANQQLLQSELQSLLQNMSLQRQVLEPLEYADLSDPQQFEDVEASLVRLYQAMITLDPTIRSTDRDRRKRQSAFVTEEGSELTAMQAVKDKKAIYHHQSSTFCQRFMEHLDTTFMLTFNETKKIVNRSSSSRSLNVPASIRHINQSAIGESHAQLWPYHPTLLFMKEIAPAAWGTALRMYYSRAQPMYAEAFAQNIASWKESARKPSVDDAEALFTTALKQETIPGAGSASMGLAAARKLTVKRSATLARTLRYAGGDKHTTAETRQQSSGGMSCETFGKALEGTSGLISQEQNFIVDFFHATSLETVDFLDVIRDYPPGKRSMTNLLDRKPIEPDREMAKRVQGLMAELFDSNFSQEMQRFIDWSISQDPLQGVGIMTFLAKQTSALQDTSQEYLLHVMDTLSSKLHTRWAKFVEDQVRAIEDTKVKIKKRKGVIGFMKVFPTFSAGVENIFSAAAGLEYDGPSENVMAVRVLIDEAYAVINRSMFDSLKAIAKESPATAANPSQAKTGMVGPADDPEDKEVLNYHVLLIENMNHYIEGVDDGGREGVLAEWRGRAMLERAEALEAYVSQVLMRPLGKLIEFLESVNSLLSTSTSSDPEAVTNRPSYSRKAARHLLAQYDAKQLRTGIDSLRRRIEKHFAEADEEAFSRQLVEYVWKELERGYERVFDRTQQLITNVYPPMEGEKAVEMGFAVADIHAGFRR